MEAMTGDRTGAALWGVLLTRVVVPLWILAGAVSKLIDGSPADLPSGLVLLLGPMGVDLGLVLHLAVAVELTVVGLIWLVPRLARPAALALLGLFAPVLVGDLLVGASSCGCFGSVKIHPAVTLAMDGGLFLGVLILGARAESLRLRAELPTRHALAGIVWTIAAFTLAFGYPFHHASGARMATAAAPGAATPTAGSPDAANKPPSYYLPDYASWVGKPWRSLDFVRWIRGRVPIVADGVQYVILYRKDCEHCHHLLQLHFSGALPAPTTVVAVPERDGFPTTGVKPMPCTECTQAELAPGCDWFFKTPVLIRLRDGVVECAAEVDPENPACLEGGGE